jgi:hypothetical protein
MDQLPRAVFGADQNAQSKHGQAAPVSHSTDGSRQESSQEGRLWMTPKSGQCGMTATTSGRPLEKATQLTTQVYVVNRQESWATPRAGKTTDENPETWQKRADAKQVATMPLTAQVKCWPKAAGGKLNPRWVETLMGLPIGWVMPSCMSPLTIAPTNCDYSKAMTETFRPFDYQLPMVEHLLANDRAALFVSPGKGKTVVTLTALDTLATCGQFKGALIVAPLRVCSITWPAQVARWAHTSWMRVANLRTAEGLAAWHDGTADIYLINSELLPNRLPLMFPKRKTFVCPVDTLVIDELSLAKNPQSNASRPCTSTSAASPAAGG